jgi:hypothetical protein
LLHNVKELKKFGRKFFEANSILSSLPPGVVPKDKDIIVQIIKKNEYGVLKLRNGKD